MHDFGRVYALERNGDLKLNRMHRLEYVEGQDAVIQCIKVTVMTMLTEDPFDDEHGFDVFNAVGTSDALFKLELAGAIMREMSDVVRSVDRIDLDREGRDFRDVDVTVTVTLIDDEQVTVTTGTLI